MKANDGTTPVKRLACNAKSLRCGGTWLIWPVSWLLLTAKYCSDLLRSSARGTEPDKELRFSCRTFNEVRLHISGGILPMRELFWSCRDTSALRSPNCGGMEPAREV